MPVTPIDRSWAYSQLQSNPALLQRLADMVKGEVGLGRDPTLERIQLESAFNRAQARNIPLDQALLSVKDNPRLGYYASDTYSRPASPGQMDYFQNQILQPVLNGSNTSQEVLGFPATGNASGQFAANRAARGIYGQSAWYSGKPLNGEMFVTERPDMRFAQNIGRTQLASNGPVPLPSRPFGDPVYPADFSAYPDANGHSPAAVADATSQGVLNPPPGQNLNGSQWNFPAMTPGQQPSLPSNIPTAGLFSPGDTPSPMTAANIPQMPAPPVAPPAPPIQIAQNAPQLPQTPQAPQTPQMGGGFNPMGLLGAIGGLASLAGTQQQQPAPQPPPLAPPFHPQVNTQSLMAFLQKSPLTQLASLPQGWNTFPSWG